MATRTEHQWCSGNINAFQAFALGSIPGWCKLFYFFPSFLFSISSYPQHTNNSCSSSYYTIPFHFYSKLDSHNTQFFSISIANQYEKDPTTKLSLLQFHHLYKTWSPLISFKELILKPNKYSYVEDKSVLF